MSTILQNRKKLLGHDMAPVKADGDCTHRSTHTNCLPLSADPSDTAARKTSEEYMSKPSLKRSRASNFDGNFGMVYYEASVDRTV